MAPRIRRAPLLERVKAYLNPWDLLLWISEELSDNEWDEFWNQAAVPIGLLFNFVFIIARSNSQTATDNGENAVFGSYESGRGSGWLVWFASFIVHTLIAICCVNTFYTFFRRRHYRLFEAPVEASPNTPSARRVHVESSPLSSSPKRYLSSLLALPGAESRAHPDASRDVWELALWDPKPLNLWLFCLFSPGHVMLYWIFLPLRPLDPRPSVTVVTTIFLAAMLAIQLLALFVFFSRQTKDMALINKEVQHEYNTKFVHPSLNKRVRNVGTQVLTARNPSETKEVHTYTPTSYVNRGFNTNPNPSYASHFDPEGVTATPRTAHQAQRVMRSITTPVVHSSNKPVGMSSPLLAHTPGVFSQPQFRSSAAGTPSGDGGSFGIYSHAHSPLKRAPGSSAIDAPRQVAKLRREGSPLKRSSLPGDGQPDSPSQNKRARTRESGWF